MEFLKNYTTAIKNYNLEETYIGAFASQTQNPNCRVVLNTNIAMKLQALPWIPANFLHRDIINTGNYLLEERFLENNWFYAVSCYKTVFIIQFQ